MPTYVFVDREGGEHIWTGPHSERPDRLRVRTSDGRVLTAKYSFAHTARAQGAQAKQWSRGLHSISMAVDPRIRKEAMKDAAKRGVPTHFDNDGCPVFTSKRHRKRYAEAYGFVDYDGGYNDPS